VTAIRNDYHDLVISFQTTSVLEEKRSRELSDFAEIWCRLVHIFIYLFIDLPETTMLTPPLIRTRLITNYILVKVT